MAKLSVTSDDGKLLGEWDLHAEHGWGYQLEEILSELLNSIENAMVRDERFGTTPYKRR